MPELTSAIGHHLVHVLLGAADVRLALGIADLLLQTLGIDIADSVEERESRRHAGAVEEDRIAVGHIPVDHVEHQAGHTLQEHGDQKETLFLLLK